MCFMMEEKLKDNMARIEKKNKEIQKLCEQKKKKKVEAYKLKIKAMADYERALKKNDFLGMKKTEEMCLKVKKLKLEAKKICLKGLILAVELKKFKIEHTEWMTEWEEKLMKLKYSKMKGKASK